MTKTTGPTPHKLPSQRPPRLKVGQLPPTRQQPLPREHTEQGECLFPARVPYGPVTLRAEQALTQTTGPRRLALAPTLPKQSPLIGQLRTPLAPTQRSALLVQFGPLRVLKVGTQVRTKLALGLRRSLALEHTPTRERVLALVPI